VHSFARASSLSKKGALVTGLEIFPACNAFGVADAGRQKSGIFDFPSHLTK